jgi:hypothetical protein
MSWALWNKENGTVREENVAAAEQEKKDLFKSNVSDCIQSFLGGMLIANPAIYRT